MDDVPERAGRDGEGRRIMWVREPLGEERGLTQTGGGQRRLGLALEAALDDELGLPVADQHERCVEPVRDEGLG
jgi:hypothetical protein